MGLEEINSDFLQGLPATHFVAPSRARSPLDRRSLGDSLGCGRRDQAGFLTIGALSHHPSEMTNAKTALFKYWTDTFKDQEVRPRRSADRSREKGGIPIFPPRRALRRVLVFVRRGDNRRAREGHQLHRGASSRRFPSTRHSVGRLRQITGIHGSGTSFDPRRLEVPIRSG